MTTKDHAAEAERLFAAGQHAEVMALADEFWVSHGPTGRGSAEVARFARIATHATGEPGVDLWQARAVAAACLTEAWRSLALSLQPAFYELVRTGALDTAAAVLLEMESLARSDHDGPPTPTLVESILTERRALLLVERKEWPETCEWYRKALTSCPPGSRRELKVMGGLARAEWLGGGSADVAVGAFAKIAGAAGGLPDVKRAADVNLAAAQVADSSRSVPFDLL